MWIANTIPPISFSFSSSHIKSTFRHDRIPSFRQFIAPTTGIRVSEAKQSHLDRIKGNIYNAQREDCGRVAETPVDNAAIIGERVKTRKLDRKRRSIAHIRWMLSTFEDGRITISPYDTAWVALIENVDGSGSPQFPSSIEWIAKNQMFDGSWGDPHYSVYDRLLNTLACVVALRSWSMHFDKIELGIRFLNEVSMELETAHLDSLTSGFEIIFPPLLQRARNLGIEIPDLDGPFLKALIALRDQKFARISKDILHEVPTALLFSLEGIDGPLQWDKLLKLTTEDVCFLTSPSATAFAFMQTGDDKCLKYLQNIVTKFDGGVPTIYPFDLYARLWAVDRLQRLGISHVFEEQIDECLNYVHRYWTPNGVFSARNSTISDLDDTAMGFRLLRLHGFNVSPDVFKHFKSNDNKFYCFGAELNASPTTLLNLYKASQVRFPGERILEEAQNFSYHFLKEKLLQNEIVDKWVISKDIAGELKFGVEIPWYACLPRVEARFYIEQYSGEDDVWIAKTLYRAPEISNNHYLEVAKLEFNECQIQHQVDWTNMLKWWNEFKLEEYGLSRENLLVTFFLASASIFEPERSIERYAWAKSWAIIQLLKVYFNNVAVSGDKRGTFLSAFKGDANLDGLDE
ncbi:OLC1v1031038C2 [Oldenlandia corymbosa var. corymbosa]|nr:OLC1v1031038C2 [Oldenlandia corymbosa var. corymbosa]